MVETIHLFQELDDLLIDHLSSLSDVQWNNKTTSPYWTVRDIAAHLLDGNLRTLSMLRDGYFGEKAPIDTSFKSMVAFLNRLNDDWTIATKRLSPKVIIELLRSSGRAYLAYLKSMNPQDLATFKVEWMGDKPTLNWMHIAREYTEKWHHQQQIRDATSNEEVLLSSHFMMPYLETSMLALPHHYKLMKGEDNASVRIEVKGLDFTHHWTIIFKNGQWFTSNSISPIDTTIKFQSHTIWRVFSKQISFEESLAQVEIIGNDELAKHCLKMVAVMA